MILFVSISLQSCPLSLLGDSGEMWSLKWLRISLTQKWMNTPFCVSALHPALQLFRPRNLCQGLHQTSQWWNEGQKQYYLSYQSDLLHTKSGSATVNKLTATNCFLKLFVLLFCYYNCPYEDYPKFWGSQEKWEYIIGWILAFEGQVFVW